MISSALRGQVDLPDYTSVSLGDSQTKAVNTNAQNFGAISSLASQYNTAQQAELQKMMESAVPGYSSIKGAVSKNIESMLAGEIPESDRAAQQLKSVSQGFGLGTTSRSAMGNLVARDLGLSQLSLMNQGLSSAQSWLTTMNKIEGGNMFDMSSMFITPQQQYQADVNERDTKFQYDYTKNYLDWTGSMGYAAAQGSDELSGLVSDVVSSAGGAAAGGCCFIFLESYHGKLPWWVRFCRDYYYARQPDVARGYKRMAKWLVPMMRRSRIVRGIVWRFMVKPITEYGGYLCNVPGYKDGWRFEPFKNFWFWSWSKLGRAS